MMARFQTGARCYKLSKLCKQLLLLCYQHILAKVFTPSESRVLYH